MTSFETPVDEESLRLHEAAEAILAEQNHARGRAPDDYTPDEYVQAIAQAQADRSGKPRTDVAAALADLGYAKPATARAADGGPTSHEATDRAGHRHPPPGPHGGQEKMGDACRTRGEDPQRLHPVPTEPRSPPCRDAEDLPAEVSDRPRQPRWLRLFL
jgi:hypothetical protein